MFFFPNSLLYTKIKKNKVYLDLRLHWFNTVFKPTILECWNTVFKNDCNSTVFKPTILECQNTVFKNDCNSTVLIHCSKTTILECWNTVFKTYCFSNGTVFKPTVIVQF